MVVVKHCDEMLMKYHNYISPFVLSMLMVLTLNLLTPSLLLL